MDCRSCGVVNAPSRRYCRECGARLGQPCPVCHFFNAVEDKHCGGCGRRLKVGGGPLAADAAPATAFAPAAEDADFTSMGAQVPRAVSADAGIVGQGVSQSEIDGLFENILDEEPGEPGESGA
jgi:hypothetical protein